MIIIILNYLETGGIVVVAKTRESLRRLAEKFSSREVNKTYLCLVRGKLEPEVVIVVIVSVLGIIIIPYHF